MRSVRHIAICTLLGALAFTASSCRDSHSGDVVAKVGARAITKAAVDHGLTVLSGGLDASTMSARIRTKRTVQAQELLISSIWLSEEAAARSVAPSQSELFARIEARRLASAPGGAAEFREYLHTTGQTRADIEREARSELAVARLQQSIRASAGEVTAAQIADYYKTHQYRFLIPERRRTALTNTASRVAAESLRRRVEAGQSLISPAQRKVGEGHSTFSNGDVTHRDKLEKAVYAARPRVLTGPVYDGLDYDLFIVERVFPARQQALAQVRGQIARQLVAERVRRMRARLTSRWMAEWTARTDCSPGYVVPKCRQYRGSSVPENPFSTR